MDPSILSSDDAREISHFDYYKYQATARNIRNLDDVKRSGREAAYIYDRVVLPELPASKSAYIAELACGHGSFLFWLQSKGFVNVAGCDSSEEQIRFARQVNPRVELQNVIDWLARQPSNSVSTLVAIDLIEHISKDDFLRFLHLSRRSLCTGGRLILRYPNGDSPFVGLNLFNDITHVWTYTTNCMRTLAKMQGFGSARFADQGYNVFRDNRWLKVPIGKVCAKLLTVVTRGLTKERVEYWSPNIWAYLEV